MGAPATIGAAIAAVALGGVMASAFLPPSGSPYLLRPNKRGPGGAFMFFADAEVANESVDVWVTPLDGSETSVENVARFMVDSFWLQSPQQLILGAGGCSEVSPSVRSSLVAVQTDDLMSKYGERMGKRKLDALIFAASDDANTGTGGALSTTDGVRGVVTIEVRLLDRQNDILSAEASERMLTQAVASLGPKQRREYKDASVIDIANQLLPPDISAVCSLSNLCVSPSARRRGVACRLCEEAERFARERLGFNEMYLRVEAANEAARRLYEDRLGYERVFEIESSTALRVDAEAGSFTEIDSAIVVLRKNI